MAKFYPKFYIRLGEAGLNSVFVQDSSGEWHSFNHYEYFKIKKGLNQISEFEIKIYDIQAAEKVYFKEQAKILFCSGNNLILKGRIQNIEYGTSYECTARGYGVEADLLDKELNEESNTNAVWADVKRGQWTNISAKTIANEILSENTDGSSPWIIQPDTTGIFSTDYGDLSIRFEYANRLKALANLSEAIDYDWWADVYNDEYIDYDEDRFFISSYKGSQSSVKTFNISGASANCFKTSYEKDVSNLVNFVTILGRGDGVNQLKTSTYAASTVYSILSSDITTTSSTISLVDASSFDSSGTIRIMEEQITYSGKSGNDLTGCSRGANSTTAKAHKKGVYTEKYYTTASPQSSSPIDTYGLMEHTIIDRTLINEETMELIATKYLLEHMTAVERIKVIPDEPLTVVTEITTGDLVTVNDSESGLSGDFRVVAVEYTSDYGYLNMEIELSNRKLEFIEQMQKQRDKEESMQKYMQGATNCYMTGETDNCDSSHGIRIDFFIPSEAVAINNVKLNYKLMKYRTWSSNSVEDSTHTHTIPSLTVNDHSHTLRVYKAADGAGNGRPVVISNTTPNKLFALNWADAELPTTSSDGSTTESETSAAGSAHSHAPIFGIAEDAAAWGVSDVTINVDGVDKTSDIETALGHALESSENGTEEDIELKDYLSTPIAGNWHYIIIQPNGNSRIKSDTYVQVFLESK